MKRDMDLARKILLAIEASDDECSELVVDADCTQEELRYHINLVYKSVYKK